MNFSDSLILLVVVIYTMKADIETLNVYSMTAIYLVESAGKSTHLVVSGVLPPA